MADEYGPRKQNGLTVSGLSGCLMFIFVIIGSFGGFLYLIMQALEELQQ